MSQGGGTTTAAGGTAPSPASASLEALSSAAVAELAAKSSAALSAIYGFPDTRDEESFGWVSNCASIRGAWESLCRQLAAGNTVDLELISAAVHDGWGSAVLQQWDEAAYGPRAPATGFARAEVVDRPAAFAAVAAVAAVAASDPAESNDEGRPKVAKVESPPASRVDTAGMVVRELSAAPWTEADFSSDKGYQKFCKRLKLQQTAYSALSEEEKEKDRVVAEVVLARYLELATPSTTGTLSIRRQDENIYSQMKAKRLLSLA